MLRYEESLKCPTCGSILAVGDMNGPKRGRIDFYYCDSCFQGNISTPENKQAPQELSLKDLVMAGYPYEFKTPDSPWAKAVMEKAGSGLRAGPKT